MQSNFHGSIIDNVPRWSYINTDFMWHVRSICDVVMGWTWALTDWRPNCFRSSFPFCSPCFRLFSPISFSCFFVFFFNLWLFILSSFFSSFHPIFIDHCRFLCLPMDISLYTIISLSFSHPFSILLFFFSSFIMCPSSPYVGLLTSGLIPSKIALSNPLSPSNES